MTRTPVADPQVLVRDALAFGPSASAAIALADALAADRSGRGPHWQLLARANLVPFAAFLLEWHHVLDRLDPAQSAFLRNRAETNAIRQTVLLRRAVELTRRLESRGIEAAWIKGVFISGCVVERPGMRCMEDIDLVVRRADFDDARRALVEDGFTPAVPRDLLDDRLPAVSLVRPDELPGSDGALRIDLHHGVAASADRLWDTDAFWAATIRRRVRGTTVTVPTHGAGVILAALHAFKHGYDTRHLWTAVADASALIRTAGASIDLEWLGARMHDPGIATSLYMLLGLSAEPVGAATELAAALRRRAAARVDELGVRGAADRVLRHGRRLRPISDDDFSLLAIGEQVSLRAAARRLFAAASRRHRRSASGPRGAQPLPARGLAGVVALARTNWRYAYTTFLVGRLAASLRARHPQETTRDR